MNKIRFKYCFDLEKGKVPSKLYEEQYENTKPYLSMDFIRSGSYDVFCSDGVLIPKNSICLLWDGANAGEIFLNEEEGYLSSTCAILKSKKIIYSSMAKWYAYYCEDILRSLTNGMGIPHVDSEILNNLLIPIYDLKKQKELSLFLDNKVPLLDKLIINEKAMLDNIISYEQNLIYEHVFNGMNCKKKKKNKCSLGINELPENWSKNKLSRVALCKSGSTPSRSNSKYWDIGEVNWMASGEVNKNEIYETNERISKLAYISTSLQLFPINTVVLALNGQGKTKGTPAILKVETTCNQSLLAMQCKETLYYKYLYYYFRAVYRDLRLQVGDESREGLSGDFIKSLIIPLPDINEQKIICDFLDAKCKYLDKLIENKNKKIKKLTQLRSNLIYDAVTKGVYNL